MQGEKPISSNIGEEKHGAENVGIRQTGCKIICQKVVSFTLQTKRILLGHFFFEKEMKYFGI